MATKTTTPPAAQPVVENAELVLMRAMITYLQGNGYLVVNKEEEFHSPEEEAIMAKLLAGNEESTWVCFRPEQAMERESVGDFLKANTKLILFDQSNESEVTDMIGEIKHSDQFDNALKEEGLKVVDLDQTIVVDSDHMWHDDLQELLDEGIKKHGHRLPEIIRDAINQ
ncbi:MAG: hypothetical protein EOO39_00135 [Cytophagaceae bacterium]|nr:MAG: hypothetical protein EOO39_00135 [Cytophagaceae bacterium]